MLGSGCYLSMGQTNNNNLKVFVWGNRRMWCLMVGRSYAILGTEEFR